MNFNSKLLNEAIADAKAVRETAVQTAISRLKETFEPTVRQLVTRKLAEEEGYDEMEEMENEEMETEEMDEMEMEAPAPEMDDTEDDMELEAIIRELEGEDDMDEEVEVNLNFDEEDDDMGISAQVENAIRELAEEEMEDDDMTEGESEDDMDSALEELLRELEEEEGMDTEEPSPKSESRSRIMRKESRNRGRNANDGATLRRLRKQLKEAYSVIRRQKETINEVALLNSKLLYLTKITSNNQLSAEKQVKVLEAFDRASSIREVKLVYATIAESIKNAPRQKKITEVASRPMRSDKKKILTEGNGMVSRWQKLAGIRP